MLDLSRVVPEAQAVVEKASVVYMHHAGRDFIGLIAHGSAVKGGFIAGCSDVDFQLYLKPSAFDERGHLPFERTVAIHRDLAHIDPAPFRYVQCYAFGGARREGWVGPIPGAYTVLAGVLPVPEATPDELRASAKTLLRDLDPEGRLSDTLLDHGEARLARQARLLCTVVWPALFCSLIERGGDPIEVWNLTKQQAIAEVPPETAAGAEIRAFYDALLAHYPAEESTDGALEVLVHGVRFLHAVKVEFKAV